MLAFSIGMVGNSAAVSEVAFECYGQNGLILVPMLWQLVVAMLRYEILDNCCH